MDETELDLLQKIMDGDDSEVEETTTDNENVPRGPQIYTTTPARAAETFNNEPDKFWTTKALEIRKYNPEKNDLLSHIEKVTGILEEAKIQSDTQKIRLLMASLPVELEYYEKVVSSENKSNYRKFTTVSKRTTVKFAVE